MLAQRRSGVSQRRSAHRKFGHALPPIDGSGVTQAASGWELIRKVEAEVQSGSGSLPNVGGAVFAVPAEPAPALVRHLDDHPCISRAAVMGPQRGPGRDVRRL